MLKEILSVSGQAGLFKLLSKTKNSIIVESLIDGKRIPVYAATRISALDDIAIYTVNGDLKLADVFISIFDNKIEVDPKVSAQILKETFQKILPDYDKNKVYMSDIKKVFIWYNLLIEKGIITEESIKSYKESLEEEKNAESEMSESEVKDNEVENSDTEDVKE
jgi:hypothetical protein